MILILLFVIPFLFGCQKEEPYAREFSIIKTLDVTDVNSSGATFNGEVVIKGTKQKNTYYGFVWDDAGKVSEPRISETYYITGSPHVAGQFINSTSFKIKISSLIKGNEYYVRVFANSDNTIVYGNIVNFICN